MGPHSCAVSGCKNNTKQEAVTFFSMPRNKERFKIWVNLIGRPDLLDKQNCRRRVCSIHFHENMIINKRLKTNAIPQLYLPKMNTKRKPKILDTKEIGTQTVIAKSDKSTQVDFTDDEEDDGECDQDDVPSYSEAKMECNGFITDIKVEKLDEMEYTIDCEIIKTESDFENLYDSELTVKTEDL